MLSWSKVACAALVFLAIACGSSPADSEPRRRLVTVEAAALRTAIDTLTLAGDVEGSVDVAVFAQLPERIAEVHVVEGQQVSEGDPLVTLEPDLVASEYQQASAALAGATAARDRIVTDLARLQTLVSQNASPRSQLDQLAAELRGAEAHVRQLQGAAGVAGSRRRRTVVRAPIDGEVAALQATAGEQPAQQTPLCRVVRTDQLTIRVHPVEQDFVRLDRAMKVSITPLARPDEVHSGTIVRVASVLDPLSRTGAVEIAIGRAEDGGNSSLRPGMAASVTIELSRREQVLMVPAEAITVTDATLAERRATVFVHRDGRAQAVPVFLGARYGAWLEVEPQAGSAPLQPGDDVIIEGQQWLREGAPVRVRRAHASGSEGLTPRVGDISVAETFRVRSGAQWTS